MRASLGRWRWSRLDSDGNLHSEIVIAGPMKSGMAGSWLEDRALVLRRIRLDRRPSGHHLSLCRRDQPAAQPVHLDRRPRPDHRCRAPTAPNVGSNPLAHLYAQQQDRFIIWDIQSFNSDIHDATRIRLARQVGAASIVLRCVPGSPDANSASGK